MSEGGRPVRLARYLSVAALLLVNILLVGLNLEKHGIFPFSDDAAGSESSGSPTGDGSVSSPSADGDEGATGEDVRSGASPGLTDPGIVAGSGAGDEPALDIDDWPGGRGPDPEGRPEPRTVLVRSDGSIEVRGSAPTYAVATAVAERAAERQPAGAVAPVIASTWHPAAASTTDAGRVLLDPPLLYRAGQVGVPADGEAGLRLVAELLATDGTLFVSLIGHIDDLGDSRENRAVAAARVAEVLAFLEREGVAQDRIVEVVAPADPDAPANDTEEATERNRRVDVEIHNYLLPAG